MAFMKILLGKPIVGGREMGKVEDALRGLIHYHGKKAARDLLDGLPDQVRDNRSQLRALQKDIRELKEQVQELVEARREQMDVPPAPEEEVESARFSTRTLKSIRKRFSLTQGQLAELLDVSHATITAWETGKSRPRKGNLSRIVTLREMSKSEVDEALGRDSMVARWKPSLLKNLRRKFGLRQDELADLLEVSVGTISGWETGRTRPTTQNLEAISQLREMSAAEVNQELGRAAFEGESQPQQAGGMPPVREIRDRAGLSQAELAEELGVSATTISNWETGHTRPQPLNVRKLLALQGEMGPDPG